MGAAPEAAGSIPSAREAVLVLTKLLRESPSPPAAPTSTPPTAEGRDEGGSPSAPGNRAGNGHGPRIDTDGPKPFDYGSGLENQVSQPAANEDGPQSPQPYGVSLRLAIVADPLSQQGSNMQADAPACDVCGSITVRSGTCYKCLNCGNSMGCS